MEYKFQYENENERSRIIEENKNKFLLEEQNLLIEGNFLIFADKPRPIQVIYRDVPKTEIDNLQNQLLEMQNYIVEQQYKILLVNGGM